MRLPRAVSSNLAGVALVVAAAITWGTWSLFLRPTGLPATATAPIMFLVMGLATLPFALRMPAMPRDRGTLLLIAANAVFDGLNVLAFFAAMAHTTVAIAVLTHYLAPIVIALAAPRIDGVIARGAGRAGLVALTGLVIILEPWHTPSDGAVLGAAYGVASAMFFAANTFTVRRIAARIGAARAVSYHSLIAAVAMVPLLISHLGELTPARVALVAAGATTAGAAAGVVFTLGLLRIGSARAAILTFIDPVVAVGVGIAVWDEPLHPLALLGGALVVGAGIQVVRNAR